MANTATNVSTARPRVAGAVYVQSASTSQLPTSADGTLTGFTSLGFISEDGLTNNNSYDSTEVKEWGGSTVETLNENFTDTFTFTLLECLNVDVLKEIFGSANVSGTLSTGITVTAKPEAHDSKKWVFDMTMRNGVLKRICIPVGAISALGEVAYRNSEAVGYNITLTAMNDGTATHYEYIKTASASSGG